jgi:hypothetical protein
MSIGGTLVDTGISFGAVSGVAAAQTVANAGTAGAATTNPTFGVAPSADGRARTLNIKAKGAILPTTLSVTLYSSDDGGATWQAYGGSIALVATTVATDSQQLNIVSGLLFQLLVTTLTLGSAASVAVDVQVS